VLCDVITCYLSSSVVISCFRSVSTSYALFMLLSASTSYLLKLLCHWCIYYSVIYCWSCHTAKAWWNFWIYSKCWCYNFLVGLFVAVITDKQQLILKAW